MKYSKLLCVIASTLLYSCSKDYLLNEASVSDKTNDGINLVHGINITAEDFILGNNTRAAYEISETEGLIFNWSSGDTIGIYPVGGDQVAFPISSGEGSKTAKFDGGAWALRANKSYAAYFPFNKANYIISEKVIPVDYTGQTQNGNNSLSDIGSHDYMAAAATQPDDNGSVNLQMKHLGCLVRLQLTMPDIAVFNTIRLSTNDNDFILKGTIDLTQDIPHITGQTYGAYTDISLDNMETQTKNQTITLFLMSAPINLDNKTITLSALNDNGGKYEGTIQGKYMDVGKAYNYTATLQKVQDDVIQAVDLGLSVKWATLNIGASSPTELGNYYAWGETKTNGEYDYTNLNNFNSTGSYKKASFDWTTYKYCEGTSSSLTKYCTKTADGVVDNLIILEPEDDAAHVNWGGKWRMPTKAEADELFSSCYCEWTSDYNNSGVAGYIIYKPKTNSDKGHINDATTNYDLPTESYSLLDNHIFFPINNSKYFEFWTSSLYYDNYKYTYNDLYGYSFSRTNGIIQLIGDENRYIGKAIRPVRTE